MKSVHKNGYIAPDLSILLIRNSKERYKNESCYYGRRRGDKTAPIDL